MGSAQSSESSSADVRQFPTADKAMHHYAKKFRKYEDGKMILYKMRTELIRIIKKKKLSEPEALKKINDLDLNMYLDDKFENCKIGNGGTLLILNIYEKNYDWVWNDTSEIINDLPLGDIKKIRTAFGG